jgi:hypothetical protein
MKRVLAPLVALLFAVVLLVPSIVLLEFHVDRARIERELCVQREMMEDMRTCHGECQLSKRFKALEQEAEAGFPAERIQVKYEPLTDLAPLAASFIAEVTDFNLPGTPVLYADGHGRGVEHVPRV